MSHLGRDTSLGFALGGVSDAFPEVTHVDVWARDLIEVSFDSAMANNAELQDKNNYTISPIDSGQSVTILSVRTGNLPYAANVLLEVSPFSIGHEYEIEVNTSIKDTSGVPLQVGTNTGNFIGRTTKTDEILNSLPKIYDKRVTSLLRTVVNAVGRRDDLIGGNRRDRLP